jgi:uncharacterized membrane protein
MTQKVVMVEYPSKGMYSLGLYNGQLSHPTSGQVMGSILIITSINPASGFTVLIPLDQIQFVDLTVEQMMKFVVSGGIVMPEKIKIISAEEQARRLDQ